MAAIIELELPTEEFALEETLTTLPEVYIEIERVVADDPEQITPYTWVRADDFNEFRAVITDDPTVESITLLSKAAGERSYRMTWSDSIDVVIQHFTAYEGTITHAEGAATGWELRAVFPDRESLSQAYQCAQKEGFHFNVQAIYDAEETRHIHYGLTEKQRETMVAAFGAGYFDVPREVTLTEFAEQQQVSHQAISERLRRATRELIGSTLVTCSEEEEEYRSVKE